MSFFTYFYCIIFDFKLKSDNMKGKDERYDMKKQTISSKFVYILKTVTGMTIFCVLMLLIGASISLLFDFLKGYVGPFF